MGYLNDSLFESIVSQLAAIDFSGEIGLHFFDEPLANPTIVQKVRKLHEEVPKASLYINSNGDYLTTELFQDLVSSGLSRLLVSQYNGNMSRNIRKISQNATAEETRVLKVKLAPMLLNNRAGSLNNFTMPEPLLTNCYLPSNQLVINYKGEVVICCSDYHGKVILGEISEKSLFEIWSGYDFKLIRRLLKKKKRGEIVTCKNCNFSGDFYTDRVFTEIKNDNAPLKNCK